MYDLYVDGCRYKIEEYQMNLKNRVYGAYDNSDDEEVKAIAMMFRNAYYVGTGKKWNDGSVGEIKMSPKEFLDLIVGITQVEEPDENT